VAGWNGWQTVGAVADTTHFSFSSPGTGASTAGNIGILVDDLNPPFSRGGSGSRPANPNSGYQRVFVVGKRTADVAVDGNRLTPRALQVNSRHHYTLTCGAQPLRSGIHDKESSAGRHANEGLPWTAKNRRAIRIPHGAVDESRTATSLIRSRACFQLVRKSPLGKAFQQSRPSQTAIDAASV